MIEGIVITNAVTKESIQLDMIDSPFVLQSADFGQISGTHQTYKYPSQIGQSLYSSNLGTRPVAIVGWVVGSTEDMVEYRKSILNSLVNPIQMLTIRVEDKYNIDVHVTSTVKYTQTVNENNECMCKFGINGTAYNPMFYSDDKYTQAAGIQPRFHFPLVIPEDGFIFSERVTTIICGIENVGVLESGMIIRMIVKGRVVNPTVINIGTQEKLTIEKELAAGEMIVINTNESSRSIVGTIRDVSSNYLKYRSLENKAWLQLAAGVNYFKYEVEEGEDSLDVTFVYRDKYLEVD